MKNTIGENQASTEEMFTKEQVLYIQKGRSLTCFSFKWKKELILFNSFFFPHGAQLRTYQLS